MIVNPAGTKKETAYVILTALLVVAMTGGIISMRTRVSDEITLAENQISAFSDLKGADQGTFCDLYTAARDIEAIQEEEGWPSVAELEDLCIPPFAHDAVWKKRGRIVWQFIPSGKHMAAYTGSFPDAEGTFVLVVSDPDHELPGNDMPDHMEEEDHFTIWYNRASTVPDTITRNALAREGFKEVIAYRGEDEVSRLRNNNEI